MARKMENKDSDIIKRCKNVIEEELLKNNKILDDTSLDKVTTEIMNISYSKGGDYSEEVIRKFAIVYIDVFL
ncbi:MAG: hypothetical protein K5659_09005 [Lachnospiraceae bacterium]|nr:hypothetical protein [Lachnospiraceae bacterium]